MALVDIFKGDEKHRIEVPEPEPISVAEFDSRRGMDMIRSMISTVSSIYPSGALEWVQAKQPDLWSDLCRAENSVDRAFLAGDMGGLNRSIDHLQHRYLAAWDLFNSRPPSVEIQEDLGLQ